MKNREYLVAIYIEAGLITLIEPDGEIGIYRQRGIKQLNKNQIAMVIAQGGLATDWENYKELPKHWSISFEDEEIMGKARATFPNPFRKKTPKTRRK